MFQRILLDPPVNIHTNPSGLTAWFTQDHMVGVAVLVICVVFVMSLWKMIKGHPVILLIVVFIALVAFHLITVPHPNGSAPPPVVPLPKGH
jgi:hypothetical protein